MKTSFSKCRIDAVNLGEIHLVMIGTPLVPLTAKFALRAESTGISYGAGTLSSWSAATNQKLGELLSSMEEDILRAVFEEGPAVSDPSQQELALEDSVPEL